MNKIQSPLDRAQTALAWGWLWHLSLVDPRIVRARTIIGNMLTNEEKRDGIVAARAAGAHLDEAEEGLR